MFRALVVFVGFCLVSLPFAHGHMWLRTPLARGGINDIGGPQPTCTKPAGSGTVTQLEVGAGLNIQFRVNKHGPGPFSMNLVNTTNGAVLHSIFSGLEYNVTAVDGFNGVTFPAKVPNVLCKDCYMMLQGMAQANNQSIWTNCADVQVLAAGSLQRASVTSLSPNNGPNTGGTVVTVTGTEFGTTSSTMVSCFFDDVVVRGTWVSNTTVKCTSPPRNQPSVAALEISINNGAESANGVSFNYTGTPILPVITSVSPTSGPPGTEVTVNGNYFYSPAVLCKFSVGTSITTVVATYVSTTEVTCESPPVVSANTMFSLEVSVDQSAYSASGLTFTANVSGSSGGSTLSPLSWLGVLALIASLCLSFA